VKLYELIGCVLGLPEYQNTACSGDLSTYVESYRLLKWIYRFQNKSEMGPLCCVYVF